MAQKKKYQSHCICYGTNRSHTGFSRSSHPFKSLLQKRNLHTASNEMSCLVTMYYILTILYLMTYYGQN